MPINILITTINYKYQIAIRIQKLIYEVKCSMYKVFKGITYKCHYRHHHRQHIIRPYVGHRSFLRRSLGHSLPR